MSVLTLSRPSPATCRDPLVGFVFLFETGPLRGEVARVVDVTVTASGQRTCVLESTTGPLTLDRDEVAVRYQRVFFHYPVAPA